MAHYQRLRDLREDADKTQQEIADYLGTSAQHYGKYESGKAEIPLERAVLLAKYYNVSLDYIAEFPQAATLSIRTICLLLPRYFRTK